MELNATILIQAVIVLFLMAWLSPMLFSPLLKVFDERERRTHGTSDAAKKSQEDAAAKVAIVEKKSQEAQETARGILTSLREQAKTKEQEIVKAARAKAQERLEEAREELFTAQEEAKVALKNDAKGIADDIVKKVLGRAA